MSDRFDFTIILPSTLPVHNVHKTVWIHHVLYAVVEGLPLDSGAGSSDPRGVIDRAESTEGGRSNSRFGSLLPRGATSWMGPRRKSSHLSQSPISTNGPPTQMAQVKSPSPPPPPRDTAAELRRMPSSEDSSDEWLLGEHRAQRAIRLIRNPDPEGGYSVLNEHAKGFVKGLGAYDIRCWSDIVSQLRSAEGISDRQYSGRSHLC